MPKLKKEEDTEWLKKTYSQSLQSVCSNLSEAFVNFFEKRAKYPRFKSKFGKQSLIYPQNVKLGKDKIYFPKLNWIDAKIHRQIKGEIRTVTLSKNKCGQYYASILFEDGKNKPKPSTEGKAIGIDLGLTDFAITSDGSKFNNPRWLAKHERNLQHAAVRRTNPLAKLCLWQRRPRICERLKIKQQQLSRKEKGSNNRNKARLKLAKVHNKIARCREDFLHKLSRRIVNENQVICVENLNVRNAPPLASWNSIPARSAVKGMVKNHKLAKAISQVGWGMFYTMLKYKTERDAKIYFEVDRFFPSSKTCNHCLNQVDSLPLDIRNWTCSSCGTFHDRDVNAAKNIKDEGLRLLELGTSSTAYSPAETFSPFDGEKVSAIDVRRSGGRKKSTATLSAV